MILEFLYANKSRNFLIFILDMDMDTDMNVDKY